MIGSGPATRRRLPAARDLRAAATLAADAIAGLVDLVEAVHAGIARVPGLQAAAPDGRTKGMTGLVYRSVRGVTRLVGGSLDALLGLLADDLVTATPPSVARENIVSALNGVFGDYLEAQASPLAIRMTLRQSGVPLPLDPASLRARLAPVRPRLALLVHGLCMNDLAWTPVVRAQDGGAVASTVDMGTMLAAADFTPLMLHYNSGLSIARNGATLATLLETLAEVWPVAIERFVLIGHSMGGLVVRSALHQARQQGLRWPALVSDMVCIGSPHQGAPLEQLGHAVTTVLAATPYAKPFARLARRRSAGITDLRHGWLEGARSAPVPLPTGVRCFALAGLLSGSEGVLHRQLLGDGLVPLASALGQHTNPKRSLGFADERTWVGAGIGHLALMSHPAVVARVQSWLSPPADFDQSATASR